MNSTLPPDSDIRLEKNGLDVLAIDDPLFDCYSDGNGKVFYDRDSEA